MHTREPASAIGDKEYFYDMISTVRRKLDGLPVDSLIKKYFPSSRLDEVQGKIETSSASELDWTCWQPLFLFLCTQSSTALNALDEDLREIVKHKHNKMPEEKICEFLRDRSDFTGDRPWWAGLFEGYVKSSLIGNESLSVESLDWLLPNGRNMDVQIGIGPRKFGVECTVFGESNTSKQEWREHDESRPRQARVWSPDLYSHGRRLYQRVYGKLAPNLDLSKSQFSQDSPNLLLIGLHAGRSTLSAQAHSIGWALDELFSDQPSGSNSPVALKEYLIREQINQQKKGFQVGDIGDLLRAPNQISGTMLFDGCELKLARINYNARECCRMSHDEMVIFEKALSRKTPYVNNW